MCYIIVECKTGQYCFKNQLPLYVVLNNCHTYLPNFNLTIDNCHLSILHNSEKIVRRTWPVINVLAILQGKYLYM